MKDKIRVIGVYEIHGNTDVHLIELEINEKPSMIDVGRFTQEIPNVSEENWQVAYDEYYLDPHGNHVIGDCLRLPENDDAPTRLAFFLYFINFDFPLLTQFGEVRLTNPVVLPERLDSIIDFEDVD